MKKKILTELSELPKDRQKAIVDDIQNRILPQVDNAINKQKFIEDEIKSSEDVAHRVLRLANSPEGTPEFFMNRSELYIFNREKIKALNNKLASLIEETYNCGAVSGSLIDKSKLESLFVKAFDDKNFDVSDESERSVKQSRFDKFFNRLVIVTSEKITQKRVAEIAYMIYCSQWVKPELRKPKREGERGKFTQLLQVFCDALKMKTIGRRPSQCDKPDDDLKAWFSML